MIQEIESAVTEVLDAIDESDEFKRKCKSYIKNVFEGSVAESDLVDVISSIKVEVDDEA